LQQLGKRLRHLRHDQGLTLAQLGQQVGLSASYLSQIERGVAMPSLSNLTTIARTLDVGVAHFFENDVSAPRVVRSSQGRRIDATSDAIVELLSAAPSDKTIQPCLVTCQPGASRDQPPANQGEGFCFVLEGKLTVTVGEETFLLEAGDSIHFQAFQPHSWRNENDEACIAIWAVSPPMWETENNREVIE
jgi:transcriptional regulator with XRE-family HTH domain